MSDLASHLYTLLTHYRVDDILDECPFRHVYQKNNQRQAKHQHLYYLLQVCIPKKIKKLQTTGKTSTLVLSFANLYPKKFKNYIHTYKKIHENIYLSC